jgi:hypothetical protein
MTTAREKLSVLTGPEAKLLLAVLSATAVQDVLNDGVTLNLTERQEKALNNILKKLGCYSK